MQSSVTKGLHLFTIRHIKSMQLQFTVRQNDQLNRKTLMLNNKGDCFYIQFYCLI